MCYFLKFSFVNVIVWLVKFIEFDILVVVNWLCYRVIMGIVCLLFCGGNSFVRMIMFIEFLYNYYGK